MPLGLDIVTRATNVHWAEEGGVFIAGDLDGNIYYLKVAGDDDLAWKNLGKLEFNKLDEEGFRTGRVAGSAYAIVDIKDAEGNVIENQQKVFVLVGGQGFANEIGIIMASRDGLEWEKVFTFAENRNSNAFAGAGIFGVVWDQDANMFYAGGHQVDSETIPDPFFRWEQQTDLLFQSSDGYHWTEAARNSLRVESSTPDPFDYPEYKTGLLVSHCSDLVEDKNGNAIPDGNYGYDKTKLLIRPADVIDIDYLFGIYLNDIPTGSSVTVTNLGEGAPPSYPSDVGLPVTCTATAGGKWVTAGGTLGNFDAGEGSCRAAVLVSSGETFEWRSVNPGGTNVIVTMTGGAIDKHAGL